MTLTTVGMALEFAGKLEARLESVYRQCIDSADDDQIKEQARSLIKATQKRKAILKMLYNDNVYSDMDTGVLAPITSMQEEDYAIAAALPATKADTNLLEGIASIEKTLECFYLDLSGCMQSGPRPILRGVQKIVKEIRACSTSSK